MLIFESSIKIFPDNPNTHNNLGTVYAIKGDVNKAELYFAKAVHLQPTYFEARQKPRHCLYAAGPTRCGREGVERGGNDGEGRHGV